MLEVEKITNRKVSDIIARNIEEWIRSGKVQPREKLPSVRELCDMFSVGRSAVRDALTTLKGKGLVEIRHGEGTFVCHFDASQLLPDALLVTKRDIHDLYQVRKILETGIVEMAAKHRTTEQLLKMEKALADLDKAQTVEAWQADYHFHKAIAEASGNEILIDLMETLSTTMKKGIMDCHRIILSDPALTEDIRAQHEAVFEAVKTKDAKIAREAMYAHLTYVEKLLDDNLQSRNE